MHANTKLFMILDIKLISGNGTMEERGASVFVCRTVEKIYSAKLQEEVLTMARYHHTILLN